MLMKDGVGEAAVARMSAALRLVVQDFDARTFEKQALHGLENLELKERVDHIIRVLRDHLPEKFSECARCLKKLPEIWDRGDPDDPVRGFAMWPIIDYVGEYGLHAPKLSFQVFEKLTPLFSAEFAIRPFIDKHPELTLEQLELWLEHPDEHVRRLVSEGSRPRLPWGMRLKTFIEDPSPIVPLLEKLRFDESQYVKRSVANNLNDIGKDHPDLVLDLCLSWQKSDKSATDWVFSHATRSLVKDGHPKVFALLGYTANPKINVVGFSLNKDRVNMGDHLEFSVTLEGIKANQKSVVDYAVHYVKANGKTAPKVFKLKNVELGKGETLSLNKQISFRKITTRKFYRGEHAVAIHINGVEKVRMNFQLV